MKIFLDTIDLKEIKKYSEILNVAGVTTNPNLARRFGMSDDDPKNVELITAEMKELKKVYPEMSFFVIQTFEDSYVKTEVLEHKTKNSSKGKLSKLTPPIVDQLKLF